MRRLRQRTELIPEHNVLRGAGAGVAQTQSRGWRVWAENLAAGDFFPKVSRLCASPRVCVQVTETRVVTSWCAGIVWDTQIFGGRNGRRVVAWLE